MPAVPAAPAVSEAALAPAPALLPLAIPGVPDGYANGIDVLGTGGDIYAEADADAAADADADEEGGMTGGRAVIIAICKGRGTVGGPYVPLREYAEVELGPDPDAAVGPDEAGPDDAEGAEVDVVGDVDVEGVIRGRGAEVAVEVEVVAEVEGAAGPGRSGRGCCDAECAC